MEMATSRICVKNLPRSFTENQFFDHFAECGSLSDAKLIHTKDGNSRGFGFVGFLNSEDANRAVQYFHKTFIGSYRISVELAKKKGDLSLDRPWSKYSKGSSRYQSTHPSEHYSGVSLNKKQKPVEMDMDDTEEHDEELKEFLDLMLPSKNAETVESLTTKKRKSSPEQINEEQNVANNLEYLKSKSMRRIQEDEPGKSEGENVTRLFVRNLPYSTTEDDLIEAFEKFGELIEVHLVVDQDSQKSKGFAFIEFEDGLHAENALTAMDGSIFQGRLIHVLFSHKKRVRNKSPSHTDSAHEASSSYKRDKEIKMKEQAGKRAAWNTFYMRPDTVMEAVSDLYHISKSDLMEKDSSELGIRLALGETQIIAKTKQDLEKAGVKISKLEEAATVAGKASVKSSIARSNDTILIKNLPYNSEEHELSEMFGSFGTIQRCIMPSTHVMAVIQFLNSLEAKNAFRQLAYKKYKSVPIYLEWAPKGLLHSHPDTSLPSSNEPDVEQRSSLGTIYVKNLSFSTKDADLVKHFDPVVSEVGGQLRSARIGRRTHEGTGSIVSAGYGFVEVNSQEVAKHVISKLNNSMLDGHLLELRRSTKQHRSTHDPQEQLDHEPTLKLIIKNLAFECTKSDLMKLFSPFGQMKTCRLPKKFDGRHRGFAFVDFVTRQEAQNAKDRTNGTHLYGRRLNIEFCRDDEITEATPHLHEPSH